LVTSAIPSEGKTTVSVNLALSLAQQGKRVLLMDFDMRNPSVAKGLGISKKQGLPEFLSQKISFKDLIVSTKIKGLDVIPGGSGTGSAYNSTASHRLAAALIRETRKYYDYIILDTPPCSVMSDAAEVGMLADCALLVVRQDFASREQILDGVQRLNDAHLPMIGCAMNHVQATAANGYGYGYGYGYGEKK
jgi:receptor protein-tyrosine kinase